LGGAETDGGDILGGDRVESTNGLWHRVSDITVGEEELGEFGIREILLSLVTIGPYSWFHGGRRGRDDDGRRLSRDLEEGFKDDSDDEDDPRNHGHERIVSR